MVIFHSYVKLPEGNVKPSGSLREHCLSSVSIHIPRLMNYVRGSPSKSHRCSWEWPPNETNSTLFFRTFASNHFCLVLTRFRGFPVLDLYGYLVGGFKHEFYFPFHIWDVILPIDELHHFSRWLLHHQPAWVLRSISIPMIHGYGYY